MGMRASVAFLSVTAMQLILTPMAKHAEATKQRHWNWVNRSEGTSCDKSVIPARYPTMFPTPVKRLAQALACSCWLFGQFSMTSVLRPIWRGWIERLRTMTPNIARNIMTVPNAWSSVFTCESLAKVLISPSSQDRKIMHRIVPIAPPRMYGLRRPHVLRLRSLSAPINGWTRTPLKGPAIHTREEADLESPIDIKKGWFNCQHCGTMEYLMRYEQHHVTIWQTKQLGDCVNC